MLETQTNLQKIYKQLMWWMFFGEWKSNISGRPRRKPIKNCQQQQFIKML